VNFYAGIGSRCTPEHILDLMERLAVRLSHQGWTLRSGHARGADQAFEYGAGGQAELFLPWQSYETGVPRIGKVVRMRPSLDAVNIAQRFHPMGPHLNSTHLALHGRNAHIVMGDGLDSPVSFVICWTSDGDLSGQLVSAGGTGMALRIASDRRIPIFNLGNEPHREWALEFLEAS
jgi:hypothetical protein